MTILSNLNAQGACQDRFTAGLRWIIARPVIISIVKSVYKAGFVLCFTEILAAILKVGTYLNNRLFLNIHTPISDLMIA
jgi:hypothetical protein